MSRAIPVHCDNCDLVVPSRAIEIEGEGSIPEGLFLSGNVEACPSCGGAAKMIEGEFAVTADTLKILQGSNISFTMIVRLAEITAKAECENLSDDELADKLAEISPEAGEVVKKHGWKTLVGALALMALAAKCQVNVNVDANKLLDQLINPQVAATLSESQIANEQVSEIVVVHNYDNGKQEPIP